MQNPSSISPIQWSNDQLILLDQRYLPEKHLQFVCETLEQATQAITDLVVRGAPAIGITAAYAVCLGYRQKQQNSDYDLEQSLEKLKAARPTAVNLAWAVQRQQEILLAGGDHIAGNLLENATAIHQQDVDDNIHMGQLGSELMHSDSRVLTHCNAGALATAGYGTALGVIRAAFAEGKIDQVFASETRPWQQGLRLTAWELAEDGVDVKVIVEGAVSSLFSQQNIDWVIVGADRICANGDVVNKVGTANLAVMCRHYGVSMMVVAPTSTIDWHTEKGENVPIEQRDEKEILGASYDTNPRVSAWNPVFDMTKAELVSAIVTEKGVVLQPDKNKMQALLRDK